MNYELISEEEFANLSEDDEQCFVEFEAICRRNMTRIINENSSGNLDRTVQAQYMAAVSSVAAECGLPQLAHPRTLENDNNFYEAYGSFSLAVQGEVARIRVRGRRSRNTLSVQLTDNTRTKIQHYVYRLREIIDSSELADARKRALSGKLDELVQEMEGRRLNLGKVMVVLSVVLAGLANTTTIAADGQAAVSHIMKLIGVDKESEEEAISRLAPPPRMLPAPPENPKPLRTNISHSREASAASDLDDEIPF